MILFPKVARNIQAEIDRVCGDRMPTLEDNLPYVRCCVKESLRWMPTAILGIPHAVIKDDEYMGYIIPKDANVVLNVWTINNNPARYTNPRDFDPTRYAHDSLTALESANNVDSGARDHFSFGAGRRVCQGMHIAERSLFLGISRLLWAFDFEKALDGEGAPITPDASEFTEGALVQPKPYPAKIVPRSAQKVQTIRQEWKAMENLLDEEGQWKVRPEALVHAVST